MCKKNPLQLQSNLRKMLNQLNQISKLKKRKKEIIQEEKIGKDLTKEKEVIREEEGTDLKVREMKNADSTNLSTKRRRYKERDKEVQAHLRIHQSKLVNSRRKK